MTKPKLVHNYSGPEKSKLSGSAKVQQTTMKDDASIISNSSGSEIQGMGGNVIKNGDNTDENRLVNMQYLRNDIGFRKLNKANKESNKSICMTRAMTIDEDFNKKPPELLTNMKK